MPRVHGQVWENPWVRGSIEGLGSKTANPAGSKANPFCDGNARGTPRARPYPGVSQLLQDEAGWAVGDLETEQTGLV